MSSSDEGNARPAQATTPETESMVRTIVASIMEMQADNKALDRQDIAKAKDLLDQGKNLIKKRIKLLRIADREDWDTVKEYVSDDLASDTEDEKELAKAIKAAAAKKEKRKTQKPKVGNRKLGTFRSRQFRTSVARRNPDPKPHGPCWTCGKIVHTQSQTKSDNLIFEPKM